MTWRDRLRAATAVLALLAGAVVTPIALARLDDDLRLIQTQPVREVEVVTALHATTWRTQLTTVMVRHPETQVPTALEGAGKLPGLPGPGSYISVVVDPADRTRLLPTAADWAPSWYDYAILSIAAALPAVALAALVLITMSRPRHEV
ncbi:hypothetical protein Kfla_1759 [Kribbella flavida DSM 17836]|uniref:Transmembrane protein n=1 Tax=Kribbella flavida (strain DSM 17836 / JCM 10339 / NBRC 14399) TaxID=479435 RepID=D2PNK2_KRIFD|nr:hypothetical protein [Kribbella flavida]ADB30854.1 hypothetical protein Kfla_1759 [Kribbella flavida DSM 17836]